MNKIIRNVMLPFAVAIVAASCAKSEKVESNGAERKYLEAWMTVNHPEVSPTGLGIYIIDDQVGTGEEVEDEMFAYVSYTVRALDGTITSTNRASVAQQLGTYSKSSYYGPEVWTVGVGNLPVGVEEMIVGMKVGGKKTAVIPSWLLGYVRYDKDSDYYKNTTESSTSIYEVEIVRIAKDILKPQVEDMEEYAAKYLNGVDSLSYGFYYKQLTPPRDTNAFKSDTTIYINYIGRLLNGQVFDTTIADTAKCYNIYSTSKTYEPVSVNWGASYSDITMGTSTEPTKIIAGFGKTLWQMRPYERGVGMFFSNYGYGYTGSGKSIPAYSPLVFEIEITDNPEK